MFGGGRYDNLVGLFVKDAAVSGVGYGMGDVTLENFLTTHGLIPQTLGSGRKVLVVRFNDVPYEKYTALVDSLRADGIVSSLYIGQKKVGKQLDFAVRDGYSHVVILGGDEAMRGVVRLKNLSTREERELPLCDLTAALH